MSLNSPISYPAPIVTISSAYLSITEESAKKLFSIARIISWSILIHATGFF
jgi:hypothetical protein